jgi:hypothetical protein
MNPLARLWAEHQLERLQRRELARMADDIRKLQGELRPALERARAEREARLRMDGPTGFVMVTQKRGRG